MYGITDVFINIEVMNGELYIRIKELGDDEEKLLSKKVTLTERGYAKEITSELGIFQSYSNRRGSWITRYRHQLQRIGENVPYIDLSVEVNK
jgi:hypothetical protein